MAETIDERLADLIVAAKRYDELAGKCSYSVSATGIGYRSATSQTSLAECICHALGRWPTAQENTQ